MIAPDKNFQIKNVIDKTELFSQIQAKFGFNYIFDRLSEENLLVMNFKGEPLINVFAHPDSVNVHFINPMPIDENEGNIFYDFVEGLLK